MFYTHNRYGSRLGDSQERENKGGLGGAGCISPREMIQNHKGGFDSASGMSKSVREWPMGAKKVKILGRPGQKIKEKKEKKKRF